MTSLLLVGFAFIIHLDGARACCSNRRVMTFGMVSFIYLFTCIFCYLLFCLFLPARPRSPHSLIWWNISMSFSLPLSLPLPHNFRSERQYKSSTNFRLLRERSGEKKLLNEMENWSSQFEDRKFHMHLHTQTHTRPLLTHTLPFEKP